MRQSIPNYVNGNKLYREDIKIACAPRKKIQLQSVLELDKKMTLNLDNYPIVSWFFMLIGMPLMILLSVAAVTSIFSIFYLFILSLI